MTTDREIQDVVTTSAQSEEVVELGDVSVETKGGFGNSVFDGGGGYYF